MNCPDCGKEMELTKKYVTRQNGIVLDGPYYTDLPNESSFSACVCRDCRRIMLKY